MKIDEIEAHQKKVNFFNLSKADQGKLKPALGSIFRNTTNPFFIYIQPPETCELVCDIIGFDIVLSSLRSLGESHKMVQQE